MPEFLTSYWESFGKEQLVTEAELIAPLVSLYAWKHLLTGRKVICFVESESAKFSMIKGSSESVACEQIVRLFHLTNIPLEIWWWFTRVPTKSHPADKPCLLYTSPSPRDS